MPAPAFAAEMVAAYPDAKVILNRRADVYAWYASFLNTFGAMEKSWSHCVLGWFNAELHWSRRLIFRELQPWFYRGGFKANGKWAYREYCAFVRGLVLKKGCWSWGQRMGGSVSFWRTRSRGGNSRGEMCRGFCEEVGGGAREESEKSGEKYDYCGECGCWFCFGFGLLAQVSSGDLWTLGLGCVMRA